MRDRITEADGAMPRFWPPRSSRFWTAVFTPLHRYALHRHHGIADVTIEGERHLRDRIGPGDGVLVCPNHSYTGDGSVMLEVSRRAPRPFCFMAAWHVFRGHWGLDGWIAQRLGGFSVDREGADRRALRTAVELLTTGKSLLVFPEGEIYHLNERLTPLREGVAFIAASAQRELDKAPRESPSGVMGDARPRVWIVPAAIRYRFVEDVMPVLERAVSEMEARLAVRSGPGTPLHQRIVRFGEFLLTIKEKEKVGRSCEAEGALPRRLSKLMNHVLGELEERHLGRSNADETIPVRVKLLRRRLLEVLDGESDGDESRRLAARGGLDDVHLVLQLYSYPGDYITTRPTPERMAETIEKFREDLDGSAARPIGKRSATVVFGQPIDVKAQMGASRARAVAAELTTRLEESMASLMRDTADERGA